MTIHGIKIVGPLPSGCYYFKTFFLSNWETSSQFSKYRMTISKASSGISRNHSGQTWGLCLKSYIYWRAWRIEIVQNISGLDSWWVGKGCLCLTLSACHFNEYQNHPHTKSRSPGPHLSWEWAPPRIWFSSVKQFQQQKVPLLSASARTPIAGILRPLLSLIII